MHLHAFTAGIRLISDEISATKLLPEKTAAGLLSHPINVLPDHDHLLHAHRDADFVAAAKARGYGADAFGCESYPIEQWGEKVAAAFLGIRLECAQCHKHPFDRWTQEEYRAFANVFGQVAQGASPEAKTLLAEENKARAEKVKKREKVTFRRMPLVAL